MPRDIACDMSVFSEAESKAHQVAYQKIFASVLDIQEREHGYAFQFPQALWADIVAYIPNEARCCPFFDFTLELQHDGQLWWTLAGTSEVKEFLKYEIVSGLDV